MINPIDDYNSVCRIPQVTTGRFNTDGTVATVECFQRCIPAGNFEKFLLTLKFDASEPVLSRPVSSDESVFDSPSHTQQISLKTDTAGLDFLLYWNGNRLAYTVDLKGLGLHGQVITKTPFHSTCWSPDERYFFYLAQTKKPETRSFFDQALQPDTVVKPGNQYKYYEDWGEQLSSISRTTVFAFDTATCQICLVDYDPGESKCITKVMAGFDGKLFIVVHDTQPFRLGLIYSTQRRSDLVCLSDWQGKRIISAVSNANEKLAILDASISPDGQKIVWLQCSAGGPHNRAFELWMANTEDDEPSRCQITSLESHPLYFNSQQEFLRNCWLSNNRLVIQVNKKSRTVILTVDLKSHAVDELQVSTARTQLACFSLLDVSTNERLLILESSMTAAPAVQVGIPKPDGSFVFQCIAPFEEDDLFLEENLSWQLITTSYLDFECQYILVWPKKISRLLPVIVVPHGGPHSVFTTAYNETAVSLALAGFAVVLVNYPGSLAFDSLEILPGLVGSLDVDSVQACVNECLSRNSKLDTNNVFIFGGSHGGFIALRLIQLYPDFYRACACRNPVTDFVMQVVGSDMPDYVFVECGLQTANPEGFIELKDITKPEVIDLMTKHSPARFISDVKCPILMALGRHDRCVSMEQPLAFCRMLQQTNPKLPLEILVYDDDHRLNSINAHSNMIVKVIQWFGAFRK